MGICRKFLRWEETFLLGGSFQLLAPWRLSLDSHVTSICVYPTYGTGETFFEGIQTCEPASRSVPRSFPDQHHASGLGLSRGRRQGGPFPALSGKAFIYTELTRGTRSSYQTERQTQYII